MTAVAKRREPTVSGVLVRLLDLLDILASVPTATATSLAEEFGVTERTVYRDVARLRAAGFKLQWDAGRQRWNLPGADLIADGLREARE